MRIEFESPQSPTGTLRVPPSKSYTHRALLVALTARGGRIRDLLPSDDTEATVNVTRGHSRRVRREDDDVVIDGSEAPFRWNRTELSAGESGTLLRFLLPLCTVLDGPESMELQGVGSLPERSNRDLLASFRRNGYRIEGSGDGETVPITCYPGQGLPEDGRVTTVADTTSQLLSGWLITLASKGGGEVRTTTDLVSKPYVEMTRLVLDEAGFGTEVAGNRFRVKGPGRPLDFTVPGDYSSAAFWIVAGSLGDGSLRLTNLRSSDPQADRYVVDLLRDLGQTIRRDDETVFVEGGSRPEGFRIDAGDCPDLVPILSVLAVFAKGPSGIGGIAHLANKESDRIARTAEELRKTGVEVVAGDDSLSFDPTGADWYPGWPQFDHRLQLESHNDHRLAMSFSVLGMLTGGIVVRGVECVDKSYPGFFRDARRLGLEFTLE